MIRPFAITMGEPAGIGGELTIQAWKKRHEENLPPFFVIDDPNRLQEIDLSMSISVIEKPEDAVNYFGEALPVLSLPLKEKSESGVLNAANSSCVIKSIEMGVQYSLEEKAAGVITNPIHKAVLQESGFEHPGHTEYIADLCGEGVTPIMMLSCDELRVVPLTVHIALKDVSSAITKELIIKKVKILDHSLRQDFGLTHPRIAITGLNPHAGEDGNMGMEEIETIIPAIEELKSQNIQAIGPYPADTLFHEEAREQYDAVIGMYHDQVLIPLKTLDFHGGVNTTLGLPVIRTSPDHGTALNIAGKGVANSNSFINAIKMAQHIDQKRTNS